MFILGVLADLFNGKSLSGWVSEPFAVLLFGIALFGITAGLRTFLNKQDKNAEKSLGKIKEAVVVNNN